MTTTIDLKDCKRADVQGYNVAQGQAYIDCKLANTGGTGLPFEMGLVFFTLACIALIVFGKVLRMAAQGRLR